MKNEKEQMKMSETSKKPNPASPESYSPKTPELLNMLEEAQTKKEEKAMGKPEIKVFRMQHDEFSFLGIENAIVGPIENADMGKVWSGFFEAGGYDKIEPFMKKPYDGMVLYHKNNPEHLVYCPGSIVEGIDEAPEGYTLAKYPVCEFLVVTTEWLPTRGEALGENGLGQVYKYQKNAPIPDGYVRFDGPDSRIVLVERENFETAEGSRYEFWIPIKKVD